MRKTVNRATKSDPATTRMEAARQATARTIKERNLLIALLAHRWPAHVTEATQGTQTDTWRYIVCLHSPAGHLAWRITEDEAEDVFQHLPRHDCKYDGATYDEKITRLCTLVEAL